MLPIRLSPDLEILILAYTHTHTHIAYIYISHIYTYIRIYIAPDFEISILASGDHPFVLCAERLNPKP
jgi:hypothetical protein